MEVYSTPLRPLWKTDVLVVGSGSAGATAALAAAEWRASVALVDRYGSMGRLSTQVVDTFCGFYVSGSEPQKVGGELLTAWSENSRSAVKPCIDPALMAQIRLSKLSRMTPRHSR